MSYRDDHEATRLELRRLEAENLRLEDELSRAEARLSHAVEDRDERRQVRSRDACVLCCGKLLPVALFAGRDARHPLPLQVSTMRFQSPEGGFTGTAALHTLACTSCGFLHNFLALGGEGPPPQAVPGSGSGSGSGSGPES